MTAHGARSAALDPRDPDYYNRGPMWPGEKLRPLVLKPEELDVLRRGLAVVVALAWGDPS